MLISAGTRDIVSSVKTCSVRSSYVAALLLQKSTAHHASFTPPFAPFASSQHCRQLRDQCRYALGLQRVIFSNIQLRERLTKLSITVPSEREDFTQLEELAAP